MLETNKIAEKYKHIGYSYAGVNNGWKPIVFKLIANIEKEMWVWWLPLFVKRRIHYLATGNSVVRIKSHFWYKIREKLTRGQIVCDIKDKYATLRVYGYFGNKINSLVEKAEEECSKTCENCGSQNNVKYTKTGWVYLYCEDCMEKYLNK